MKALFAGLVFAAVTLAGCVPAAGVRTGAELSLRGQANAAYAKGETAAALDAYRKLVGEGAADVVVWTRIGNLELLQNHPHRAAEAYDHAVQLDPTYTEAWHNMALIRLRQAAAMLEQERASLKADDPHATEIRCEQARLAIVLKPGADPKGCKS
jgi:predicted Zn-dependent protease